MSAHGAVPPTPQAPFWHDEQGRRTDLQAVAASSGAAELQAILGAHAEAVCGIVRAAAAARLADRRRDARVLAAHASRLCGELAGLWPAGSHEPLG